MWNYMERNHPEYEYGIRHAELLKIEYYINVEGEGDDNMIKRGEEVATIWIGFRERNKVKYLFLDVEGLRKKGGSSNRFEKGKEVLIIRNEVKWWEQVKYPHS